MSSSFKILMHTPTYKYIQNDGYRENINGKIRERRVRDEKDRLKR